MAQTLLAWTLVLKRQTEVLFFVEARPGSPMLLLRKLPYTCLLHRLSLKHCSDIFIIWARCKWDGKVRGFILEKACRRFFKCLHGL
jgi:hypothetical protein